MNQSAMIELKNRTEILDEMFEKVNLKVLQFMFRQFDKDEAELIIELQTVSGEEIPGDVILKINLYDKEGEIFFTEDYRINQTQFYKYDTYSIPLFDDCRSFSHAKSAKIFITKDDD